MFIKSLGILLGVGMVLTGSAVRAESLATDKSSTLPASSATLQSAGTEQLAAAVGHYARSRSLLIAAIREFDSGYQLASPDALLNSKVFRNTLITRAQELEHVLDPQPRLSKGGVSFNPDSRLLGGSK